MGNTTSVSLGVRVRPRAAVEPERGCVSPVCGALTSGSMKSAMSSVTMMYSTTKVATVRLGVQAPVVKVGTVTLIK